MKKSLIVLVGAALIFASSCHTQRIMLVKGAKVGTPTVETRKTFLIMGLVGNPQETTPADVCGGKTPVAVETTTTFMDGFLGGLTGNIWSPATVRVYCQ